MRMSQIGPWLIARFEENRTAGIVLFVVINLVMNITASASFKLSAGSADWRGFAVWQVAGNLAGFITVLTLTALLRFTPISVAVPLTTGLAIIGVQIIAATLFFHEKITAVQWLGTTLIIIGIVLVARA
jgi:multidrug transporter EmrE-like cation transporter